MAGAEGMTVEVVVGRVLLDERAGVVRGAVRAVAVELMELEVSELVGAEFGEWRPAGPGDASQWVSAAAPGDEGG